MDIETTPSTPNLDIVTEIIIAGQPIIEVS